MFKGALAKCAKKERAFAKAQQKSCLVDACMDPTRMTSYCSYPDELAKRCEAKKIRVGVWQSNDYCGALLCKGGEAFMTNYLGERTCAAPNEKPTGPRESGCFCKRGMYRDGTACVSRRGCGCSKDGIYLKRGESKITDKCTKMYICPPKRGRMKVKRNLCHRNAKCVVKKARLSCKCKVGFGGNPYKYCRAKGEPNTIGVGSKGELPPSSFIATSNAKGSEPSYGRLGHKKCWRPKRGDRKKKLTIALLEEFVIYGFRLQGCPNGKETLNEVTVFYSKNGRKEKKAGKIKNIKIKRKFVEVYLDKPIKSARFVSLVPRNKGPVGLRVEVIAERSNCKPGYQVRFGRSCYKFMRAPKDYKTAQQICSEGEAYIAEIFDKKENKFVRRLSRGRGALLGMRDRIVEGRYVNEHSVASHYKNFPKKYKKQKNRDCVLQRKSGKWREVSCKKKFSYVCENGGGNYCPLGWHKRGGGCYKRLRGRHNFNVAMKKCDKQGGHIPEITSREENTAVSVMAKRSLAWTAACDINEEGKFVQWPSLRPLSFTAWAPRQPDNHKNNEDCTVINWKRPGKWNDISCNSKHTTVCEFGVNKNHVDSGACASNPCGNRGTCRGFFNPTTETDDYKCYCRPGFSGKSCDQAECDCHAWGDPHFTTCDGQKFDFQGICNYVLAQDGCGEGRRTFQIVIRTVKFPRYPGTSRVKTVHIHIDYDFDGPKTRLSLGQKHKLRLNGDKINHESSIRNGLAKITFINKKTVVILRNGVKILWDGRYRVDVKMDAIHQGKVCGLCGNFNEDKKDDIPNVDGRPKISRKDIAAFGESAQLFPGKTCDKLPPLPPDVDKICKKASKKTREMIQKLMRKLKKKAFRRCLKDMNEKEVAEMIKNIRMEGCATGKKSSICDGLESIALKCKEIGHDFCWDKKGHCAKGIGKNERYFCGDGYDRRCGDSKQVVKNNWGPIEGAVCKKGYRRLGTKCVKKEDCGCRVKTEDGEEFTLRPNERKMDRRCTNVHICAYNEEDSKYEAITEKHHCHPSAICRKRKCRCGPSYKGNGYRCKYIPDPTVDDLEGFNLGVSCGGYLSNAAIRTRPPPRKVDLGKEEGETREEMRMARRTGVPGRLCRSDEYFRPGPKARRPFIQIDQVRKRTVRAVIVKGFLEENCWPRGVIVKYSNNRKKWRCAKNKKGRCVVYPTGPETRKIAIKSFRARYVRVYPLRYKGRKRNICIQVELFGGDIKCPKRFMHLGGGCYKRLNRKYNYEDGASRCASIGGYLTEVSSPRELRALRKLSKSTPFFLGLRAEQEVFENPKGSPTFYSNWGRGEPNPMDPSLECVIANRKGKWIRTNCKKKRLVICEILGDALAKQPDGNSLGVRYRGRVDNDNFEATSSRGNLEPNRGRLYNKGENSAWSPEPSDKNPHIQVDLEDVHEVTGGVFQGRGDKHEFMRRFRVSWSENCKDFQFVRDNEGKKKPLVFYGPADAGRVGVIFEPPFKARCIRVHPVPKLQRGPVSMRFDLYGRSLEPKTKCMNGFLKSVKRVPNSRFATSSCPARKGDDDGDEDDVYCAKFARWSKKDRYWRPETGRTCELSEVDLGRSIIARGIRVRTRKGKTLPDFRVQASSDGMKFSCVRDKKGREIFRSEKRRKTYHFEESLELRKLRVIPVTETAGIMYDILGCELKQKPKKQQPKKQQPKKKEPKKKE